jgi:hypothetical protein
LYNGFHAKILLKILKSNVVRYLNAAMKIYS